MMLMLIFSKCMNDGQNSFQKQKKNTIEHSDNAEPVLQLLVKEISCRTLKKFKQARQMKKNLENDWLIIKKYSNKSEQELPSVANGIIIEVLIIKIFKLIL